MPRREVITANLPSGALPYSPATRFGNTIHTSAIVGVSHVTGEVGKDITEQTRFSLERIKHIVESAGSSMGDVLSCFCFIRNAAHFEAFIQVYTEYFPTEFPARLTVTSGCIRDDFLMMIMCTAAIPDGTNKKEIIRGTIPPGRAPVSPCTRFGNLVYMSGTVGVSHVTGEVGKGVGEQTRFALDRIKYLLEEAGTSLENVLTANCFLKTNRDFLEFNDVWQEYFPGNYPGRATVTSGFVRDDFLVEIILTACIPDGDARKEIITRGYTVPPLEYPGPSMELPVSAATIVGNMVFISGSTGFNYRTGALGLCAGEQTRFVLEQFKHLLERGGSSLENVLSVTTFLANKDDFSEFNDAYREFFPSDYPARLTVESGFIYTRFIVEIMMVACIPD